jgi:hypothetical protein
VKPNINSVEVHPEPSNNRHPVDATLVDATLVDAGSGWPSLDTLEKSEEAFPNK